MKNSKVSDISPIKIAEQKKENKIEKKKNELEVVESLISALTEVADVNNKALDFEKNYHEINGATAVATSCQKQKEATQNDVQQVMEYLEKRKRKLQKKIKASEIEKTQ